MISEATQLFIKQKSDASKLVGRSFIVLQVCIFCPTNTFMLNRGKQRHFNQIYAFNKEPTNQPTHTLSLRLCGDHLIVKHEKGSFNAPKLNFSCRHTARFFGGETTNLRCVSHSFAFQPWDSKVWISVRYPIAVCPL